jgi:Tfp pilus assembly protein PilW
MRRERRGRLNESGFTIVELLIYFIIAVVVVAGVYNLLMGQNRLYIKQRELEDVRTSLRAGANLLAFELRQASAAGGDIYSIDDTTFAVRSLTAAGIVCGVSGTQPRAAIWGLTGELYTTSDDSVMVFASAGADKWVTGYIDQSFGSTGGGVVCDWANATPDDVVEILGSTPPPPDVSDGDLAIEAINWVDKTDTVSFVVSHPLLACSEFDSRVTIDVDADQVTYSETMNGCVFTYYIPPSANTLNIQINIAAGDYAQLTDDLSGTAEWQQLNAGQGNNADNELLLEVETGAPLRAFRRVQYGIYEDGGRYWLGRKVGAAVGYEKLTGPLSAPGDSGLYLVYYDASGNTTSTPQDVRMVDIILRAESYGKVPGTAGPTFQQDTLTLRVSLRG